MLEDLVVVSVITPVTVRVGIVLMVIIVHLLLLDNALLSHLSYWVVFTGESLVKIILSSSTTLFSSSAELYDILGAASMHKTVASLVGVAKFIGSSYVTVSVTLVVLVKKS